MNTPRPETEASLERAAMAYLRRFAASSASLRRVLRRRLSRAAHRGAELDRPALEAFIEALLVRYAERGLLDDDAYARGLALSLRRRGRSRRFIQHRLREKGLEPTQISAALEHSDAEAEDAEATAARRHAQRRRLGPFRTDPQQRRDRRQRDLAAMARAGFSFPVARAVIDDPPG